MCVCLKYALGKHNGKNKLNYKFCLTDFLKLSLLIICMYYYCVDLCQRSHLNSIITL